MWMHEFFRADWCFQCVGGTWHEIHEHGRRQGDWNDEQPQQRSEWCGGCVRCGPLRANTTHVQQGDVELGVATWLKGQAPTQAPLSSACDEGHWGGASEVGGQAAEAGQHEERETASGSDMHRAMYYDITHKAAVGTVAMSGDFALDAACSRSRRQGQGQRVQRSRETGAGHRR